MSVKQLYNEKKPVLSFEVFPPKKDADIETIYQSVRTIAALSPDFISVTYGAGGQGGMGHTGEIAGTIEREYGCTALAHLTCIGAERSRILETLDDLARAGVQNVLALRGDPPVDGKVPEGNYRYAVDLIQEVRVRKDFCVGAACYPEGHIDCERMEDSIGHLKEKQAAGADFLITQLFFDNSLFWRFLEKARASGITLPVSAGVMPILSRGQVERMIFLCGASLPSAIIKLLHRYEGNPADLRKAGIEFALRQMEDLARGGVDGIHAYTMNRPEIAAAVSEAFGG